MPRNRTLALILAGGEGSRLEVLTERRAKPAVPFAGVYRLIDFPLSNCMHSGITDVWIVEQYEPHSLNEHLANGRPWDLDRTHGGLRVLPPYLGRDGDGGFAQGNADAIYRHRERIREWDPEVLLVLSTDHIYRLDFRKVIDFHLEHGADATLVTTRVSREEAGRFAVIGIGAEGRITDFAYKPDEPQHDTVAAEVFVYRTSRLLDVLDELTAAGSDDGESSIEDFGDELLPRLVGEGNTWAFPLDGYWRDVGTPDSYWRGHMDLLDPELPLRLDDPAWPILTAGAQRLPARAYSSARIDNSLISPGCQMRGEVFRSVLGPGTVVEEGAVVRDSVIWNDVRIGRGARISCAIIDDETEIGDQAEVGKSTDGDLDPADDLVLIGRGAKVDAGDRIAAGARIDGRE